MDKNETLKMFINDKNVSTTVYDFLKAELEKPNGTFEVQLLAAERLALMALKSAWSSLEKLRSKVPEEEKPLNNVGL